MPAVGSPVFAVGQYTVVANSLSLGIMEGDDRVPVIEQVNHAEPVANTDAWGKALIEAFNLGADRFLQFTALETRPSVISQLWPFSAFGGLGIIGVAYSSFAVPFVLTAVSGTPAVTSGAGPNTITAAGAILAPNYNTRILYGPSLRKYPLRFALLPYMSGGNAVHFTLT